MEFRQSPTAMPESARLRSSDHLGEGCQGDGEGWLFILNQLYTALTPFSVFRNLPPNLPR